LAPLSHLALAVIGEGECVDDHGARIPTIEPMREGGVKPLVLEAKEAVSLINGTQGMLAVGTLALLAAETLVDSADVIGAMTLDALRGTDVAFDERIHNARPHPGQVKTAANLRRLLDTIAHCREVMETEINSSVDNPLVFPRAAQAAGLGLPEVAEGDILSGGNFHGEPVAFVLDFLGVALGALAGISERRLERMVNPSLNEGLPPFLAQGAGLNSGFMMAQVTAAALASENKVLAHPASVDSITTSGNKEDYVSMGMTASLKLKKIVENARQVLAIEAMAAAQALDFLAPLKTSKRLEQAYAAIRAVCPTMEKDRVMYGDFARVGEVIAAGRLGDCVR
jgi:histidine ammonia-lyase